MKESISSINSTHICPLCGKTSCYSFGLSTNHAIWYDCNTFYYSLRVSQDIDNNRGTIQHFRYDNLIFEHCTAHPVDKDHAWFYYVDEDNAIKSKDGWVNLARIPYPKTFSEKVDRVLLNLSRRNSQYGAEFSGGEELARAFFDETAYTNEKYLGMTKMLVGLEYLAYGRSPLVTITAKGWRRIDELIRNQSNSRNCFVAMAYGEQTESIREAIREGADRAGYKALLMDEKEHNNQIVPEMLHDIENSRFVIMDVSFPNYGAYYEVGYAQGQGKQVIITCREKNKRRKRPHFDIQQQPIIYWNDEEDLVERLKKRIRATIGMPFEIVIQG